MYLPLKAFYMVKTKNKFRNLFFEQKTNSAEEKYKQI